MLRHFKRIALVAFAEVCVYAWGSVTDAQTLNEELLRLHVVGASDSEEDQDVKLLVRDAVLRSLEEGLRDLADVDAACDYVAGMLPQVEAAANRCLAAAGFDDTVSVSLTEEAFPTREYDTFSLPAGVYKRCGSSSEKGRGKTGGAWCSPSSAAQRGISWRPPAPQDSTRSWREVWRASMSCGSGCWKSWGS